MSGPAATAVPTAVLGLQVAQQAGLLPSTGVAVGMYVAVALACIAAGLWLRYKASRMARAGR